MPVAFDLQSHSTWSDGELPPAEVVAAAAAAGVELLALTDHDDVDGVDEALAAGRASGVRVVVGAELSTLDGEREDLHVCGYELDVESADLRAALDDYRADRQARVEAIADRLEALGFTVDRTVLEGRLPAALFYNLIVTATRP